MISGINIFKMAAAFIAAAVVSVSLPCAAQPDAKMYAEFRNPAARYRPFVRWWWNGDKVEAEELVRELRLLKEAGIGGVEINPIEFPAKEDPLGKEALVWLSDGWIDMLKVVFDEAERLGMQCDLIVGSGWPFGSESLPPEERASVMLTYALDVDGGQPLEISKFTVFKAVDPGVTVPNPRRTCSLVSAYLVPDPVDDMSQVIDVTKKFDGDVLKVDVPSGKYVFYALVRFDSFASVINGAPGAAGSILNHMDSAAVRKYLDNMSSTIEARLGSPLSRHLRAFFVDSMELEGNNWTDDFAEVFRERRGYDLMPWLPFTMFKVGRLGDVESFEYGARKGPAFKEKVDRVRFDFELTKAELLHERYTATFLEWCRKQGVKARAQAYGRGFFPLESSLGYDFPEGESWTTNWLRHRIGEEMGDEDYRRGRAYTMINKYVSSAAHLAGRRTVSCEEMTNTYKVFTTSLEFLKVGSDMSAISGTTHSVWHGFNYSPPEAEFPGWVQYGSYYNENNPWWPYFRLLNDYRARMSSMLQNADMVTDIAILPANSDMWTEMGVQTDPFPVKLNVPYTSLIWEAVHKTGGGADYVSESVISDASVSQGRLCYGPKKYSDIFLVDVCGTTPSVLHKLLEFVQAGGRVFCIGQYPSKSLGFKDFEVRDAEVRSLVAQLRAYPDRFILLENPSDGKYLEWYDGVAREYGLPHAATFASPDRFLLQNHYLTDNGEDMFLFVNAHMSESRCSDVCFDKKIWSGKTAWLYDPCDGKRYKLPMDRGHLNVGLGPSETWLVVFGKGGRGEKYGRIPAPGADTLCVGSWSLSLRHGFDGAVSEDHMDCLVDLKDTEAYRNFMGEVTYSATISLDAGELPRYIDLGKVADICELTVNGVPCGVRWFGERRYDLDGLLHAGENVLEVKVTTLMGNYLQSMPDNAVVKRFITRREQPYVPAGLIGPVKLY